MNTNKPNSTDEAAILNNINACISEDGCLYNKEVSSENGASFYLMLSALAVLIILEVCLLVDILWSTLRINFSLSIAYSILAIAIFVILYTIPVLYGFNILHKSKKHRSKKIDFSYIGRG